MKSSCWTLPTRRGYIDLDNFSASGNILTLAVGFNAVLVPNKLEFGVVYSTPIATQRDYNFNGLLVKWSIAIKRWANRRGDGGKAPGWGRPAPPTYWFIRAR